MIVSVGRLSHRASQQSPVTRHRLSCERVHLHSTLILKKNVGSGLFRSRYYGCEVDHVSLERL